VIRALGAGRAGGDGRDRQQQAEEEGGFHKVMLQKHALANGAGSQASGRRENSNSRIRGKHQAPSTNLQDSENNQNSIFKLQSPTGRGPRPKAFGQGAEGD